MRNDELECVKYTANKSLAADIDLKAGEKNLASELVEKL